MSADRPIEPVPLSKAGRPIMTFPVIYGIPSALMEFQFGVSAYLIPQDAAHNSPAEGERAAFSVALAGVSRYTDLAT